MTETLPTLFGIYGLSYRYRGGAFSLEEVSFELERGEIVALLGPNGSGKSTLMKVASGLLPLNQSGCSGQIRHHGMDFLKMDPAQRARYVAYVGSDLRAEFPLTAEDAVEMGLICHGTGLIRRLTERDQNQVQQAMERCFCWNLRDRDLHTLSGGERQLVAIARALVQGAQVLFLDESLSKMDLNHQAMIGKLLRSLASESYSILVVSHDVNLASEWADTCLFLNKGRQIAFGPLRETLNEERIRSIYPGANLTVGKNPATGAPKVFFGG